MGHKKPMAFLTKKKIALALGLLLIGAAAAAYRRAQRADVAGRRGAGAAGRLQPGGRQ